MADLLAFKGDVLRFSVGNTGTNGEQYITLQVYNFSKSSRCFQKSTDRVLSLDSSISPALEFVSVKCLLNTTSGLYQPCLLLRQAPTKRPRSKEFKVFLLEDYDSVSLLGNFEVNHSETSHVVFHLCDGPSVCWTLEGSVYCARYDSTLEKFTVDSLSVDNSMNEQPGVEFNLLWCGLVHGEMVAMGAKSELSHDDAPLQTRWTCVNHSRSDIQEIPLVPNVYVPIATCCFVRETNQEVRFGCSNSGYEGLEVFLTTNRGQLLEFLSGCLKSCWQLPFNDPYRIWMLEPEPGEVIVMVASETRNVCAVNCKNKKVMKEWHEIEILLTDDFLEKGNEQVLFLPKSPNMSESEELSNFSLIDARKGMSSIECSEAFSCSESQLVTDSLQKTAQALRTRLQAKAATLHEAKLESHEKQKMIEHCCKVVKNVASSCGPRSEEKGEKCPGLFCLLEGAVDEDEQHIPLSKALGSALTVKEIWQRIVYDQWIVGIDMENTSESAVSDLVLGLVSCRPDGVSYSSKTVFSSDNSRLLKQPGISRSSETDDYMKSPFTKKSRVDNSNSAVHQKLLPGNQTRLTAVSSLPRFTHSDSCSLSVVVTWTSHCVDGTFDQHSMHCGHVTLDTEQILNGSLKVNSCLDCKSVQKDIVALQSVSIKTELVLQSSFSRAHQIISLVKSSVRDVPVLQTEPDHHGDIFGRLLPMLHDNGPLAGAGIVLKDDLEKGHCHLTLLTRNKNQVFLLLHRLRQVLPNDIRILADPAFDLSSVKDALRALNNEATNLQQILCKLMEKPSKGHAGFYPEESGHEQKACDVKALREGFERKREAMAREEILSEQEDLETMWNDSLQDQMSTDIAVAKT